MAASFVSSQKFMSPFWRLSACPAKLTKTGNAETWALGVRNSVGGDVDPRTGKYWFTENARDWISDDVHPDREHGSWNRHKYRKALTVGSASANKAVAHRRREGLASRRAHSPSAHNVRPWLSSEPRSSSQVRLKPMKLRNRLVIAPVSFTCCVRVIPFVL